VEKRVFKLILIASTIIVGITILLQHVHYVVDVAVAPFFTYTSYKIIDGLKNKLYSNSI